MRIILINNNNDDDKKNKQTNKQTYKKNTEGHSFIGSPHENRASLPYCILSLYLTHASI